MDIPNIYAELAQKHETAFTKSSKHINLISSIRLVIALLIIASAYQFFTLQNTFYIILAGLFILVFLVLIKVHGKYFYQKKINRTLADINQDEHAFLSKNELPFDDGIGFAKPNHFYAQDLDIFGENSLYQHLNRTYLKVGNNALSKSLLDLESTESIKQKQKAIQELTPQLDWRQEFTAICKSTEEKPKAFESLLSWSKKKLEKPSPFLIIVAYVIPVLLGLSIIGNIISDHPIFYQLIKLFVVSNLLIALSQLKFIKKELVVADGIQSTLENYSRLITKIENHTFTSKKLIELQTQLTSKDKLASQAIQNLSAIYGQLEGINNPFGALFFNGAYIYHIHALHKLKKWKSKYAQQVETWIPIIGEFETIISFANFSYNNPAYTFPNLNNEQEISFTELGHPLLLEKGRVSNSVSFDNFKFIILTGSNMSGKSTFLRSLGINMVLAQAGAPVCAKAASIQPMPILVSMRVTDSLGEGESFFFAEVKRLKEIMEAAQNQTSFVLLDEILRGTNSDDKRTGTVGVIEKIISKSVFGAIATHDLKVCETTLLHPSKLSNKCFEVEIENNELAFDYTLRDGVCKNKSATFLMKKMEVI